MDKAEIRSLILRLYTQVPGNIIPDTEEFAPECRGLRLYDAPLVGFGSADDPLFETFRAPAVIGPWHRAPRQWLPEANTVISMFFPIAESIRRLNAAQKDHACLQWAYARVDGQNFMQALTRALAEQLQSQGLLTCIPILSPGYGSYHAGQSASLQEYDCLNADTFSSSWSERHAAYVCGLGTFSLTRGLITEKGMAGRFISLLTDAQLPADERPYTGVYDYCIRCGACVRRCPAHAISLQTGKDQNACYQCTNRSAELFRPRYGCGLCQTGVPCESGIPGRR